MEPRHPGVVDPVDPAAQGLGGQGRLLAHGCVAGAGADHGDGAGERPLPRVGHRQLRLGGVAVGEPPPQQGLLLLGETGDDDVVRPAADHGAHNALDLSGGLPLAEDDLRRALAAFPLVVYLGVAQVLVAAQELGGGFRRGHA